MSHVIYPTTNFKATEQLTIERGEGVYVYDNQGNRYLEGMAGLWCTALGYGNEEVIEAATAQMRKLTFSHMFGGKTHQPGIDLADKLSELLPMDNAALFFGTSGSDANDTQIKLLRYYFDAIGKPEKRKIIARERSYHGVSVAAASLTGLPVNQQHFHLPVDALGILRTDHPHYYRGRLEGENETEFVERIINNLVAMIEREGSESIAAFIAEPITGASGVIVPPPGYYEKLREVLDHYNILLWADEVITGFGRTGNDFGVTTMNMGRPDMMTLAKQLSSAYVPISAAAIRGDMYQAMVEQCAASGVFGHGYTYSGHPLGCAVALKVIEIFQRDRLFERAAEQGEYLQQQLATFADHPLVGEIRGRGLIGALELVADKATGKPFADGSVGAKAQQFCQDNGLILRTVAGSSLAFCPPLIISRAQIDEMIDKTRRALQSTLDFCHREKLLG